MPKAKKQLAVRQPAQIAVIETALTVEQVIKQRHQITQLMKEAMKDGEHFGKIPGCGDKPTLLQPGAQLLSFMFHFRPEYEIKETDLPNAHKRYRITCRLYLTGTRPPMPVGEGLGESSSLETKHRFRNAAAVIKETGQPLPRSYWTRREQMGDADAKKWLSEGFDGQNVGPKKINGQWMIVIYEGGDEGKVENQNPADTFNTVLKIAKKRAFVDATITATASSDFFTQDLEDIAQNRAGEDQHREKPVVSAKEVKSEGNSKGGVSRPTGGNFAGPKHEELNSTLDFDGVSPEDFMAAARARAFIPPNKMTFGQLPEQLASELLGKYKEIVTPDMIDKIQMESREGAASEEK